VKRLFAILLCTVILLSLCSCTGSKKDSSTGTLLVGFGRTDISPQEKVMLKGYYGYKNRFSGNILDPLYATCVAFTDGDGNTILLYHLDLIGAGGSHMPFVCKDISDATGIPQFNIMMAGTHTHSAPFFTQTDDAMNRYNEYLSKQMYDAAMLALEDRKPAQMYATSTIMENMNFVRHYRTESGSVVGDNFGDKNSKVVGHVREPDKQLQLVRFKREGGKDVVLVNWQAHPHRTGGSLSTDVSADIVGSMRMYLEPRMDCYMAYFTGASGNLNPTSRISSENITADYIEQGTMMAQKAIHALDDMTKCQIGKVQILRRDQMAAKKGNAAKLATYAFSLGDVAFITAPYEMFDTNGKFIKENSPFPTTFVVTCANSGVGYIPAEWAYYEDVEAYEVYSYGFNKGVAEDLANGYVEMLNEIYTTRFGG